MSNPSSETPLGDAVRSADRRTQLEGLRDFLVNELEGHRCKSCMAVKLRTSDTAALVLRLDKVLEELAAIPAADEEVSTLDDLRERRAARMANAKNPAPADRVKGRQPRP